MRDESNKPKRTATNLFKMSMKKILRPVSWKSQKLQCVDDEDAEHIICSLKISTFPMQPTTRQNKNRQPMVFAMHRSLNQ